MTDEDSERMWFRGQGMAEWASKAAFAALQGQLANPNIDTADLAGCWKYAEGLWLARPRYHEGEAYLGPVSDYLQSGNILDHRGQRITAKREEAHD